MDITIDQLRAMTPEERDNLNRTLGKKVMKKFLIYTAIKIGAAVTIAVVSNRMANKDLQNH